MSGDNEGRPTSPETDGASVASEPPTRQTTSSQFTHFEGFISSPTLAGESDSKNVCERKPFLVAGQGWTRYVASLKEGRRYVPKGGHVVDFSALDEKESKKLKMKSLQSSQPRKLIMTSSSTKSVNRQPAYCHHNYSSKADEKRRSEDSEPNDFGLGLFSGLKMNLLKGSELSNTFSPAENSPPGRPPARVHSPPRPSMATAPSATLRLPQWKPAGKLGKLDSFLSTHTGKKPMEGLYRLKTPEAKDSAYEMTQKSPKFPKNANKTTRSRCQDCKNLAKSREELAQQKVSIRQERTALIQMRRRIESDQSKLTKDKQEFETYKSNELDRLHSTASKLCWRLQRDAMAFEARQREFLVKVQSESSDANQGQQEEGERSEEVEHLMSKMEAERNEFRNRERRLEQKISELEGQLLAIRLNNKNRHVVVEETDKKPSNCVSGEENGGGEKLKGEEGSVDHVLGHLVEKGTYSPCPPPADLSGEFQNVNDSLEGALQNWESECESSYVSSPETRSPRPLETMMVLSPAVSTSTGSSNETFADPQYTRSPLNPQKEKSKAFAPTVRCFENGTICKQWLDGHSMTTYLNGDLKQTFPSGITEYYYASAQVWQVSHPSKIEVYYFPSGRVEAHHPGGEREVLLPSEAFGAFKVGLGGMEEPVLPSFLCAEVLFPRPQPLHKT